MYRAGILILVTILLAILSRKSLADPRSHGFYRYFAWLAIVGLILLNLDAWFREPVSALHLASWLLLVASLVFVIDGTRQLQAKGKQNHRARDEAALLGIERTTELVTTGVYRYVRHPMYSSLLLLAWGALLKNVSWEGIGLAVTATVFLVATAKAEESENVRFFGETYRAYMRRTKLFLPFLF